LDHGLAMAEGYLVESIELLEQAKIVAVQLKSMMLVPTAAGHRLVYKLNRQIRLASSISNEIYDKRKLLSSWDDRR
jgi:hypothetical protein